jgi:tetratricopeptide (TPR) repeat protein
MWSLKSTKKAAPVALAVLLCACSSTPQRTEPASSTVVPAAARPATAASNGPASPAATPSPATAPALAGSTAATAPPVEIPARAAADFGRAVGMMRTGKATEAELEFQQIAVAYPQFAGADINLGILYRKTGRLEQSEQALRAAVARNGGSAVGWNELGVTLRMRGQFPAAAEAYQHAIAADANFAPAYRNLGVLLDLYEGDAPGALTALQHYKELTGEEKPVNGWIAELKQRAGKNGPPPQANAPPAAPVKAGDAK